MQKNTKKTRHFSTLTPKRLGLFDPLLWVGLVFVLIFSNCGNTVANNGENSTYSDGICGPGIAEISSHGRVAVATEQYGSGGGLTIIDLDSGSTAINVALIHDDVTLRWYDDRIWVLNRYGADNIMFLDGNDYHLLKQFSVKIDQNTPCNPHDIAFLD